jgi:hypothetical protein
MYEIKSLDYRCGLAIALSNMREKLINDIDAIVMLGGKVSGYRGKYPGILEEFLIALNKRKPIYLLGAFGGASKEIINLIRGNNSEILTERAQTNECNKFYREFYNGYVETKYDKICSDIKKNAYTQLNNGLSVIENDVLFISENAEEIIKLVIKGLVNVSIGKEIK